MKTITISLSTIKRAISRAGEISDNWQAELLEILMIPAIHKRWQELNPQFPGMRLERIDGTPHVGYSRDDNLSVTDWSVFAGYRFVMMDRSDSDPPITPYCWNSVRSNGYGHSPSTAWDGIRRETYHRFVESLRMLALGHDHHELWRSLDERKIRLRVPALKHQFCGLSDGPESDVTA